MSWSFDIQAGDLYLVSDKSGAAVVTGSQKTYQDLRSALLEPMGSDPMHPEFGSLLDGGRLPNGRVATPLIGQNFDSVFKIEEEISRIIQDFISRQSDRVAKDISNYGRTTISDSEIVRNVASITSRKFGTKLVVRVELIMKDGSVMSITQPV